MCAHLQQPEEKALPLLDMSPSEYLTFLSTAHDRSVFCNATQTLKILTHWRDQGAVGLTV